MYMLVFRTFLVFSKLLLFAFFGVLGRLFSDDGGGPLTTASGFFSATFPTLASQKFLLTPVILPPTLL